MGDDAVKHDRERGVLSITTKADKDPLGMPGAPVADHVTAAWAELTPYERRRTGKLPWTCAVPAYGLSAPKGAHRRDLVTPSMKRHLILVTPTENGSDVLGAGPCLIQMSGMRNDGMGQGFSKARRRRGSRFHACSLHMWS